MISRLQPHLNTVREFSKIMLDSDKARPTKTPFHTEYNYWQDHDGTTWKQDAVWGSYFPKFGAASMKKAIGIYWDYCLPGEIQIAAQAPWPI